MKVKSCKLPHVAQDVSELVPRDVALGLPCCHFEVQQTAQAGHAEGQRLYQPQIKTSEVRQAGQERTVVIKSASSQAQVPPAGRGRQLDAFDGFLRQACMPLAL